jgi:NAD-dependent deacetylase
MRFKDGERRGPEDMQDKSRVEIARHRLQRARTVTVLTGAGVSADSGVPTFRGSDGLWRNFRAEDLATPEAFGQDPRLVWEWYNWRREILATKQPNAAHHAIVEMERRIPGFWLITQNVDGLHPAAGSRKLSEIHGNIWKVRCTNCGMVAQNTDVPIVLLPTCVHCGSLVRPHIVWFGESLDSRDMDKSHQALSSCELLLIVGTSGVVYPAASFGAVAKSCGAYVIELNLDPTPLSDRADIVDLSIQGRAKDLLPALLGP